MASDPAPASAPAQAAAPADSVSPPTSRPVPAPVPDASARSAGGRRRGLLATAAVVVVLIAAAVIWAVTRADSDPGSGNTSAGAPTASPAAPPAGTPSGADPSAGDPQAGNPPAGGPGAGSSASAGASSAPASGATPTPARTSTGGGLPARPSGWVDYRDPTGFALYVPRGWTRSKEGNIVYFRSRGRVLGIDQTRKPARNPVADWRGKADYRVARGDFPSYREVHIKKVDYFRNAADWEFTFTRGGVRQHVNNRGLITADDQAYGIYWQTRDADWDRYRDDLELVFDSFRPARRD